IGIIWLTDPVRPGDAVGLQISQGPELFEIPDISGLGLQEAMDTLAGAGFSPTTLVPEALRGLARATGSTPAAGERVEAGTEIRVTSQLSL
uniref:PASTA domain-containing protein n=1 Tax=Leucobacter sp. BZR 635 TaxID=3378705 RepID=UPI003A8652BF